MGILDRCESRRGAQVIWLAVHDTEGGGTARQLRDASWWEGSSHAIADNLPEAQGGGLLTPSQGCVPYDLAAWTLRGGNRYSDNIEQVGMASWSRAKWLTQELLLDRCARWLADRHKARPWIPLVKLSPADVAARRPGVIGHVDYTLGTKLAGQQDGSHTDPGPGYPWDVVIAKARAYASGADQSTPTDPGDPDMRVLRTPDGTIWLATDQEVVATGSLGLAGSASKAWGPQIPCTREEVQELINDAAGRRARLLTDTAKAAGGDIDEAVIVAGLLPLVTEAVSKRTGATREEIAELLRGITLKAS